MSLSDIENALLKHLNDMPAGVSIAWPGLTFKPNPTEPWIKVEFLPAALADNEQEIGPNARYTRRGSLILTPVYPIKKGPGPLFSKVEALEDRFKRRQTLSAGTAPNDFALRLIATDRGRLLSGDGWNSLSVSIRWRATTPA